MPSLCVRLSINIYTFLYKTTNYIYFVAEHFHQFVLFTCPLPSTCCSHANPLARLAAKLFVCLFTLFSCCFGCVLYFVAHWFRCYCCIIGLLRCQKLYLSLLYVSVVVVIIALMHINFNLFRRLTRASACFERFYFAFITLMCIYVFGCVYVCIFVSSSLWKRFVVATGLTISTSADNVDVDADQLNMNVHNILNVLL